jgi:hypothetical protein
LWLVVAHVKQFQTAGRAHTFWKGLKEVVAEYFSSFNLCITLKQSGNVLSRLHLRSICWRYGSTLPFYPVVVPPPPKKKHTWREKPVTHIMCHLGRARRDKYEGGDEKEEAATRTKKARK